MLGIGLMSGTSADGIDVAIAEIVPEDSKIRVSLKGFRCIPYSPDIRDYIFALFDVSAARITDLAAMNFLLGEVYADAILQTVAGAGLTLKDISFIGSHGQTVYHQPCLEEYGGRPIRSTLQIGEAAVMAERTGLPVVSDFRVRDLAAGGQGAPLVAYVDALLFAEEDVDVIAANIGGIANITVLPSRRSGRAPFAFDTGPGNMLIDALMMRLTQGRETFDQSGRVAKSGEIHPEYLRRWLKLSYFAQCPPKSTGREQFGGDFADEWWRDWRESGNSMNDMMATATEFTVQTFVRSVSRFVLPDYPVKKLWVSGGGAHNLSIMEGIERNLPGVVVLHQDQSGIPADAKEAVAFAVLGYQTLHRQPNNLPSATGAQHSVVMGKISWP